VQRSLDGGATWTIINNGLSNLRVVDVAADPAAPGRVWVATDGGGVFLSTDSGDSWTSPSVTIPEPDVLAIELATNGILYAGSDGSLRRKYSSAITEDRETFDRCTDTIIRQVGDVTRMVDEFSAFARSPKPQMEDHDLRDIVRAAVLDRQMAGADIAFDTRVPKEPIVILCDRRLISQAVGNLVKNAQEAIAAYAESANAEPGFAGRIETIVRRNGERAEIEVIDNGAGLPKQRSRLLEPYVTTKGNKGTGLGLAIVQKSVEQHNGALTLEDAPLAPGRTHGALIRITLPIGGRASTRASSDQPAPAAVGGA
jgi:two-component system nitrogen regulation sensor histidine kinase NtrY